MLGCVEAGWLQGDLDLPPTLDSFVVMVEKAFDFCSTWTLHIVRPKPTDWGSSDRCLFWNPECS